ncbi:cAMP-dependent protein kinase catalytic subunit 2-like, partial [Drosophila elegans]|uniref:cAMP-dependent protein kinase catalytic subunit 2-like n=1 Tax=Drosophila elegans TaxID=30023 RepID=UPI001BC83811
TTPPAAAASSRASDQPLHPWRHVAHVHNQKHVLNAARFPFLIHLADSTNLYLILPLINGGELFSYQCRVRKFNKKQARFYASQVELALMYWDLKPENILLDQRGYIKLTDIGFTKNFPMNTLILKPQRVDGRTSTMCEMPEYLAPEIVELRPYNKSVDWCAFGIFVYEFVAGCG